MDEHLETGVLRRKIIQRLKKFEPKVAPPNWSGRREYLSLTPVERVLSGCGLLHRPRVAERRRP